MKKIGIIFIFGIVVILGVVLVIWKIGNAEKSLLEEDETSIEKVIVYISDKDKTVTEKEQISEVANFLKKIQLGEENSNYDKDGIIGSIRLCFKNGKEKRITFVGEPYVSVGYGENQCVYRIQKYGGKEEYIEAFQRLYRELK